MFGFHSLTPTKLYTVSETRKPAAPKSRSAVMGDTQSTIEANGPAALHSDGPTRPGKDIESQPSPILAQQHSARVTESQDSGVAGTGATAAAQPDDQGVQPKSHIETARRKETQHGPAAVDFTEPQQAEAGPSRPRPQSSHSSLQADRDIAPNRPDETHENAIAYRRDLETVIAYLVPLPKPTVQGTTLDVPTRYFLYAPPPPHLLKPPHGGSEGYVRKLNRHWQQNLRKAKSNAHNGKRVSLRGLHSKAIRASVWGMDRLKYDDVTFLARIHPKTVTHLILIHPWALSGVQTPADMLRTFRAQVFAGKKKAKRDSILSAVFFLPALVIDTGAIFFGGLAEMEGIWMLASISAYRTARVITRKIGPEPKTMEIEQHKLIEDAKRSGFPPPQPEPATDSEPGAIRRSVDALRRSMGSVKYRMSQRRSRSRRRKGGGDSSSPDTSRPQTNEASRSDLEGGFLGGELEHYQEEEEGERPQTSAVQHTTVHSGQSQPEFSGGFLEHYVEEEATSSGGIQAGGAEDHRTSAESRETSASKKKGQNFQLTFYPSPAMDVLTRYLQETCHNYNGQAYASPSAAPTEKDALAVMGWHPEKRQYETADQEADDEQWQIREIEDDLKLTATKAAKAWNKTCRKQAKKSKRFVGEKQPAKKGVFAGGRFKARSTQQKAPAKKKKGKANEASPADSSSSGAGTEKKKAEKPVARAAPFKAQMAAVRAKTTQRKQQATETDPNLDPGSEQPAAQTTETKEKEKKAKKTKKAKKESSKRQGGRAAAGGAAALLCMPCIAVAERAKKVGSSSSSSSSRKKTKKDETNATAGAGSEASQAPAPKRQPLKQRLSDRSTAMKRGLSARGDELRQRMEARNKAKKGDDGVAVADAAGSGPEAQAQATTDVEGQTPAVGAARQTTNDDDVVVADHATTEANNNNNKPSGRGRRLLAIPAGAAAGIGAAIKKRRPRAKQQKTTTPIVDEGETTTTTKSAKPSRFSALKERIRALRTRITKKRRTTAAQTQKDSSTELNTNDGPKEGKTWGKSWWKKSKKTAPTEKPARQREEPKGSSVKEHGAIVGMVAGCLALPAAKAKQVRDKRRNKGKAHQPPQGGEAGPAGASAGTGAAGAMTDSTTTSGTGVVVDRTSHDRPTYQPPIVEEEEEAEAAEGAGRQEQARSTTQYLPGHGQSEIPVHEPGRPLSEPRLNSSDTADTAVETTTTTTTTATVPREQPPQHQSSSSAAAAVRFKSIRDGFGNLKQRRRASPTDGQTEKEEMKKKKSEVKKVEEPPVPVPVQGGRRQTLRSGLDNFKAKRRAGTGAEAEAEAEAPAPQVDVPTDDENLKEKKTTPAGEPAPAAGGRFRAIKDGIESIKAKRAGTQGQQPKEKVYKDHTPGFIDRLRWIWYVA